MEHDFIFHSDLDSDDYFIRLENIFFPVKGEKFEYLALMVTFFIAHEYGAKVLLFHINDSKNNDTLLEEFSLFLSKKNVKFELEIKSKIKDISISNQILKRIEKGSFQLIILTSRRRLKFINKYFWNSISGSIIPYIRIDCLQVYPPKDRVSSNLLNVACLVPNSRRDPYLIRWASAVVTSQAIANLVIYHIDEYPQITPREFLLSDPEYIKHKDNFEQRMKTISTRFAIDKTQIQMVLGNKLSTTLETLLLGNKHDLVIMGASRPQKKKLFGRNLTERLIDSIKCGVIVHHWKI